MQAITFVVILAVLGVVTIALRGTLDVALLLLPVVLLALVAFVLGLSLAAAVLHAYFRDVAPILSAALLPWFFLSPIFFRPEDITGQALARAALEWGNPIAPYIEAVRTILYSGAAPGLDVLAYVLAGAALSLLAGRALFGRLQAELAVLV